VSVGMREHVGAARLPAYFAAVHHALRPGGLFLTNDRLLELPAAPVRSAGEREVTYMKLPDSSVKGDHLTWYQTPR